MAERCPYHEQLETELKLVGKNVNLLLTRGNDFYVKVINGKTEERLASELIGEMYVAIGKLKDGSPKKIFQNGMQVVNSLITLLTLAGLIVTMITVFSH